MPNVLFVVDPAEPAQAGEADRLRVNAPAGFVATVAPIVAGVVELGAERPDVVVVYAPLRAASVLDALRAWRGDTPIVARWLPLWPRGLAEFHALLRRVDGVLFAHPEYWERLGRLPGSAMAPPGIDLGSGVPRPRSDKVVWIGARHPSNWGSLEAPERRLAVMSNAIGVAIDVLPAMDTPDAALDPGTLRTRLESGTVAVCAASRADTPLAAVEAAAAGCAVVTVAEADPFGFVEHGVNGFVAERTHASILEGLKAALVARDQWATARAERLVPWSWPHRAATFFAELLHLAKPARALTDPTTSPADLSESVTVFVTTVGAPSLDACLCHLERQDARFRFELIDRVAPMSAAFQRMLDRCTTPHYVQVDEDMLLYPWAVRVLHETIAAAPPDVALVVATLHDAHLDRSIQGVKIFRHGVVRRYPLLDKASFELEQIERLERDGYRYVVLPGSAPASGTGESRGPFGLHGTHWTTRSVYERYYTLKRAHRIRPQRQKWLEECVPMLLRRFLEDGSDLDFYALMAIVGATVTDEGASRAKDFRGYGELPGFRHVEAFLRDLRAIDRRVDPTATKTAEG